MDELWVLWVSKLTFHPILPNLVTSWSWTHSQSLWTEHTHIYTHTHTQTTGIFKFLVLKEIEETCIICSLSVSFDLCSTELTLFLRKCDYNYNVNKSLGSIRSRGQCRRSFIDDPFQSRLASISDILEVFSENEQVLILFNVRCLPSKIIPVQCGRILIVSVEKLKWNLNASGVLTPKQLLVNHQCRLRDLCSSMKTFILCTNEYWIFDLLPDRNIDIGRFC